MQGTAFVFINLLQAARFGHVAWGFSLDETADRYYFGSTDHLFRHRWWDLPAWCRYAHLPPLSDNDWWAEDGDRQTMLRTMSDGPHLRYHLAKVLRSDAANPQAALQAAETMRTAGWSLLSNNCVHQTYKVISEYGCALPKPGLPLTVIPKTWFNLLPGAVLELR